MNKELTGKIFSIEEPAGFQLAAFEIYKYQRDKNPVYSEFIKALVRSRAFINKLTDIPFLPAEFFRSQTLITDNLPFELIFESSGTTGLSVSRHYVHDAGLYEESFLRAFRLFYGDPEDYFLSALLPSYTERENSSLVYMVNHLIKKSLYPKSGFYKNNLTELISNIHEAKKLKRKILLLGVSYALLDMAEKYSPDLNGVIVMETGGMKGRRKEFTREELHDVLNSKFNVLSVHSEYGMTELLSQAYSKANGIFYCPPWMKVLIRDPRDPLTVHDQPGKTGGINVIDLANIYSCSFVATGDLGRLHEDGGFEVLGRFDNSDIRGCNLLVD